MRLLDALLLAFKRKQDGFSNNHVAWLRFVTVILTAILFQFYSWWFLTAFIAPRVFSIDCLSTKIIVNDNWDRKMNTILIKRKNQESWDTITSDRERWDRNDIIIYYSDKDSTFYLIDSFLLPTWIDEDLEEDEQSPPLYSRFSIPDKTHNRIKIIRHYQERVIIKDGKYNSNFKSRWVYETLDGEIWNPKDYDLYTIILMEGGKSLAVFSPEGERIYDEGILFCPNLW